MIELGRPSRLKGAGFYEYVDGKRTGLWPGLRETFKSGTSQPPLQDMIDRMLFAEALETQKCLDEGVLTSTADANIGSIMGIGFPPWTGGSAQYIVGYPGGKAGFVARAKELAAKYGDRFNPPDSLTVIAREDAKAPETTAFRGLLRLVMPCALLGSELNAYRRPAMADVKLIPLNVLLGHPERTGAQISPDGRRLSYIAPLDGVLNVFVGEAGTGDERPVTHDTARGIEGYMWAHDNRHIMYVRDKDGSENFRLYDVDLETGVERDLTPVDGVQCRLIAHRKEFPNDVLIGLNKDNPQLHDVYHLDLTTGKLEKIVENPGFLGWVVDTDLKVRGAVTPLPDGGAVILVRDDEASDWRPLLEAPPEDAESTGPLGFTKDGDSMYLQTSVDSNTGRLVKMDIATGAVDVIAEDPVYDISGRDDEPRHT